MAVKYGNAVGGRPTATFATAQGQGTNYIKGNADIDTLESVDVTFNETARISAEERDKIVPENIVDGVTILGVTGTASGGGGSDKEIYEYYQGRDAWDHDFREIRDINGNAIDLTAFANRLDAIIEAVPTIQAISNNDLYLYVDNNYNGGRPDLCKFDVSSASLYLEWTINNQTIKRFRFMGSWICFDLYFIMEEGEDGLEVVDLCGSWKRSSDASLEVWTLVQNNSGYYDLYPYDKDNYDMPPASIYAVQSLRPGQDMRGKILVIDFPDDQVGWYQPRFFMLDDFATQTSPYGFNLYNATQVLELGIGMDPTTGDFVINSATVTSRSL